VLVTLLPVQLFHLLLEPMLPVQQSLDQLGLELPVRSCRLLQALRLVLEYP
jgi:hypothetical protein